MKPQGSALDSSEPRPPNLVSQLAGAITLLTRIPLPNAADPSPRQCVWAYPIVGALVGAIGALALAASRAMHLPPLAAGTIAVAAMAATTGGLHEDGLADTFDALGGGRTPEHRLAILKDSRIGAHGALALLLATLLRAALVAPLTPTHLILAATLGRAAMLIPLLRHRPARPDGLAAAVAPDGRTAPAWTGLALTFPALAIAPAATLAALAAALLCATWFARRFDGFTGDTLGSVALLAELSALGCCR